MVTWLILSILNLVPIVDWIVYGVYVKVLRGEEPDLENLGKTFIDGLLALIIGLIYMIVPIILIIVVSVGMFTFGSVTVTPGDPSVSGMSEIAGFAVMSGLIILSFVVAFLFSLLATPAVVNFARGGFGAAFSFGTIFGMISKVGWLKYILAIIVIWIIFAIISLLGAIPFIGWLIMIILAPFLAIWSFKYFANLFE